MVEGSEVRFFALSLGGGGGQKLNFEPFGGVGSYIRKGVGGSEVDIGRGRKFFRPPHIINNDWALNGSS